MQLFYVTSHNRFPASFVREETNFEKMATFSTIGYLYNLCSTKVLSKRYLVLVTTEMHFTFDT